MILFNLPGFQKLPVCVCSNLFSSDSSFIGLNRKSGKFGVECLGLDQKTIL